MISIRQIQGFRNQFVNFAGVTADDRYAVFYVTDVREEEEITTAEPYRAGVLRYDYKAWTQEFFSYGAGRIDQTFSGTGCSEGICICTVNKFNL